MSTAVIMNPDNIVAEIRLSMNLKDWKQVRKTLRTNADYTELQVINEIYDLVNQIEQVFYNK